MERNIQLSYVIAFLKNPWFWLGIWVFYYLQFTDYTGIGLIETVLFTTATITEIPTGAIADLLGKKKTLMIGFFLSFVCNSLMALAPNIWILMIAVFIGGIGMTFVSGTFEAFIYDSLVIQKKEKQYESVISKINSLQLAAPAGFSILGGFLYTIDHRLPFFLSALCYLVIVGILIRTTEPPIDSDTFSLKRFLHQTKVGFDQLFNTANRRQQTFLLLTIGAVIVITYEMLDGFLAVEYGYSEQFLGVFWAIAFLIAAFTSHITPRITSVLGKRKTLLVFGVGIAVTLLLSPLLAIILGGITILLRSAGQAVIGNVSSVILNDSTESKYRATTISTFNMIKNIPYVFIAFGVGYLSAILSAKNAAVIIGGFLLLLLALQLLKNKSSKL